MNTAAATVVKIQKSLSGKKQAYSAGAVEVKGWSGSSVHSLFPQLLLKRPPQPVPPPAVAALKGEPAAAAGVAVIESE